jgi:hypothetical protein
MDWKREQPNDISNNGYESCKIYNFTLVMNVTTQNI